MRHRRRSLAVSRAPVVISILALVLAACGGAGKATPTGIPVETGVGATAVVASPAPGNPGATVLPDPCTFARTAAIESAVGEKVGSGMPISGASGASCEFDGSGDDRLIVIIDSKSATLQAFLDTYSGLTKEDSGFGEATRTNFSEISAPQADLIVYSKGLTYQFVLTRTGATEADLLARLRTLAQTVTF
jgi:hypothetical protein